MTSNRVFQLLAMTAVVCVLAPASIEARSSPSLESKGFIEEHNWFSPFPWEHFDAVSANILLTFTDLALPGNGGRELRFERVFNSSYGYGDLSRWRFGLSGMVIEIVEKSDPPDNFDFNDDIRVITDFTPVLAMSDGARHPTAYVSEPNGHTAAQLRAMPVVSGVFFTYRRTTGSTPGTLLMPDGTGATPSASS